MSEKLVSDDEGDKLWVEIYNEAIEIPVQSEAAGHPVYREVPFITIRVPGDQLNVVKRPVTEDDKKRFPRHWEVFSNAHDNKGLTGWLLEEWPAISRAVAFQLRTMGFKTVEHVANATDANLARLGMACGMHPHTFRDKARAFLEIAEDTAKAQEAIVQRDAQKAEIARLEAQIAQMGKQFQEMMASQAAAAAAAATSPQTVIATMGALPTPAPAPIPAPEPAEPPLSKTELRAKLRREREAQGLGEQQAA